MAEKGSTMKELFIEFPSMGQTYCNDEYGVYAYDEYPSGSVLEGMERRTLLGSFDTMAEAEAKYPDAVDVEGSLYAGPPNLDFLPDNDGMDNWPESY